MDPYPAQYDRHANTNRHIHTDPEYEKLQQDLRQASNHIRKLEDENTEYQNKLRRYITWETTGIDETLRISEGRAAAADQRASEIENNLANAVGQYNGLRTHCESLTVTHNALVDTYNQLYTTHQRCAADVGRLTGALVQSEEKNRVCTESLAIHQSANQRLRNAWNQRYNSYQALDDSYGPDYTHVFDLLMQETDETNRINGQLQNENERLRKTIREFDEKAVVSRMEAAEARTAELEEALAEREEALAEAREREQNNHTEANDGMDVANEERRNAEEKLTECVADGAVRAHDLTECQKTLSDAERRLATAEEPQPTPTDESAGGGKDDGAVGLLRVQVAELEQRVRIVSEHGERVVESIRVELASAHETSRELDAKLTAARDTGEPDAKRRRTAEVTHVPLGRFVVSRPSVAFGSFH